MKKPEFAEAVVTAAREFVADFKGFEAASEPGALVDAQRSLQELKNALAAHAEAPCEHRWDYPDKSHRTCRDCGYRVEAHEFWGVHCNCGAGPLECYRHFTRRLLERRRRGNPYPDISALIAERLNDCRAAMTGEERARIEAVIAEEQAFDRLTKELG